MKRKFLALLMLLALLTGCAVQITPPATEPSLDTDGKVLTVHYIDVGQADCALLTCGDEAMLIDGGNVDDGSLVVTYLQDQGIDALNTVVCTHAHEDHVGGLASVLAVFPTEQVLSPTTTYSSRCFDDFLYYADQQRIAIQIPDPGYTFTLGSAQVTVLGPVKSYAETNDTSIVLKVVFGETSFLFTGDMEVTAENDMLDYGMDVRADVLKVGHHGSDTSTGYRFLYEVDPEYAVISVGQNNSYGHPHQEPLSRLNDAGCTILRTDLLGTVTAVSDGYEVAFTWEDQSAAPDNTEPAEIRYIGNKNSKKFHSPDCANLPAEKNQVIFDSYQEAVESGYSPCGSCLG